MSTSIPTPAQQAPLPQAVQPTSRAALRAAVEAMLPDPPARPITQNAYAKHRAAAGLPGGTATAVAKAVRDRRITVDANGRIADPVAADAEWERNSPRSPVVRMPAAVAPISPPVAISPPVNGAVPGEQPGADPPVASIQDRYASQAAKEYWQAEKLRLEVEEARGNLLQAQDVAKALGDVIVSIRSKALFLPSQLANRVAIENDPRACEAILKEAVSRMLTELSKVQIGAADAALEVPSGTPITQ